MRIGSLSTRLLASVSVLLVVFFGLTIGALDLVFRDLSERELWGRLEIQLIALLSASEEKWTDKLEPAQTAEVRFGNPGSGLYGEIRSRGGLVNWRSASMAGTGLEFKIDLLPGQRRLRTFTLADGSMVAALSRGIRFEFDRTRSGEFVFTVAENLQPRDARLTRFRRQMFGWFTGLVMLLLLAMAILFRWVLAPLRRVEHEIEEVEAGRLSSLGDGYPSELLGVTTSVNTLLRTERERLQRYRNTLGNLAHSLKTPLAVMRNLLNSPELRRLPAARQLDEQVGRMDEIVGYQLKKAATSGPTTGLGRAPVDVRESLEALRGALSKVYIERGVRCQLEVSPGCGFIGDPGDLTEIAGNLLDNAFKYCRSKVQVSAEPLSGDRRAGLKLVVEDDGPGIPATDRARVLERGARLDERVGGQGIGLSVVREMVRVSGGSVEIGESALGGARLEVRLPAA
jgi:two-component system sensor histidine kinase PhoQ